MKNNGRLSSQSAIAKRNDRVCQMCGAAEGEDWQTVPGRQAHLTTGYFVPISVGGRAEDANRRILCDECNEGLEGVEYIPRPPSRVFIAGMEKASPPIKCEVAVLPLAKTLGNGYTCQMCGIAAGDPDPFMAGRTARLTMGHILDKSKGGKDTPENLRAVCANCNEGLQNSALPKPDRIHLLAQVRRATIDDQQAVLGWLQQKFSSSVKKKR